jgi:hypothetical protein
VVTVDKEERLDTSMAHQRRSVRPWWRRGHTYFLGLVLLLNIVLDRFAFQPEGSETVTLLWGGILLAQTFLMGFWMALGGLHSILRGIAVAGTTVGGALAFWMSLEAPQNDDVGLRVLVPLAATIVLGTYVLLLPLRLLMSWRVDFDRAYHARRRDSRMQLRLADCINVVTSFALLFGCVRCLASNVLPVAVVGGGIAFFNSLPIALVSVTSRPSAKVWLLSAAVLVASLIAEYVTLVYALASEPGLVFAFEFALAATLLVNLLPLRFASGLHLFSVAKGTSQELAAELAERGLAEVKAAWPTLSETIRDQIVTLARGADVTETAAEYSPPATALSWRRDSTHC